VTSSHIENCHHWWQKSVGLIEIFSTVHGAMPSPSQPNALGRHRLESDDAHGSRPILEWHEVRRKRIHPAKISDHASRCRLTNLHCTVVFCRWAVLNDKKQAACILSSATQAGVRLAAFFLEIGQSCESPGDERRKTLLFVNVTKVPSSLVLQLWEGPITAEYPLCWGKN